MYFSVMSWLNSVHCSMLLGCIGRFFALRKYLIYNLKKHCETIYSMSQNGTQPKRINHISSWRKVCQLKYELDFAKCFYTHFVCHAKNCVQNPALASTEKQLTFDDLHLTEDVVRAAETLGFNTPTSIQVPWHNSPVWVDLHMFACLLLIRGHTHFWETTYSQRTVWKKLQKQPSR